MIAVIAWRWTPVIVVAVVAGVLAWKLDLGRRAASELARETEKENLRLKGVIAQNQVSEAKLKADAETLARHNAEFAAELERVKKAAPDARPVAVSHATTGRVEAGGTPVPPSSAATPATSAACLLRQGDIGEVRVDSATLQTRAGNVVMIGAASAWRLSPEPETRLFGGALKIEGSVERVPLLPGWGFGATAWAGRSGWMVGPAASLPPFRLWGLQGELSAGASLGPSGEWGVGATALVRRWR